MMQPLLIIVWPFLKKLNTELAFSPAIPLLRNYPSEIKTYVHTKTCKKLFKAALFIIAKKWKQSNYSSTGKWIKKCGITHPMKYYSATKRNKIPIYATTWINLGNSMLSERHRRPHII